MLQPLQHFLCTMNTLEQYLSPLPGKHSCLRVLQKPAIFRNASIYKKKEKIIFLQPEPVWTVFLSFRNDSKILNAIIIVCDILFCYCVVLFLSFFLLPSSFLETKRKKEKKPTGAYQTSRMRNYFQYQTDKDFKGVSSTFRILV